ncbi:MAG: hypothetical protein PSV16_04200 [Flavobacterium sp.]|nr:hypothetical protein [Flavobacterium sp.]
MKNTTFFDHMKCIIRNNCHNIEVQKTEIQKQEIKSEKLTQDNQSKLNFQFIDLDKIFAN